MNKKIFGIFLAALLIGMTVSGCKKNVGTSEDNAVVEEDTDEKAEEESGFTFGFSCIDMNNPYYDTLQLAIQTEVNNQNCTMISKDPALNSDLQIEQIQDMIDSGIDAIFLCPVDWEAITPALEALHEAEIPIINIDTEVKAMDYVTAYIGSDNKNAGYVCGEDLMNRMPKGGNIVILECPTMNSINDRITGFEEAIADGQFVVVDRINVEGDLQEAMDATTKILEKYDNVDVIMCGNDQTALGALVAVNTANRIGVSIYGVDGSPDLKKELAKPSSSIKGTGAQSPISIGKAAVNVAMAVLNGEKYEPFTYESTFFINSENVELYGTDGWQ
ncbi:MAG: sugar ABC transporter substrate-binding protein [Hespellia sp.]|nr:sugar ABC transporter substrate-binding protein [Hespellia sp.]